MPPTLTQEQLLEILTTLAPQGDGRRLRECAWAIYVLTATGQMTPTEIDLRSLIEAHIEALNIRGANPEIDQLLVQIDRKLRRIGRQIVLVHGRTKTRQGYDELSAKQMIPASHWWAYPARSTRPRQSARGPVTQNAKTPKPRHRRR